MIQTTLTQTRKQGARYQLTGGRYQIIRDGDIKAVLDDRVLLSPHLDDHDANEYVDSVVAMNNETLTKVRLKWWW